ncbi:MAG: Stp1/IreP family PP2C-type Ser/Thr phosphatase [Armatimonadota bacterium]|nr:Stp1/IreP family PP2C-type Ser/Thr phosphatase [bacterium]
MEHEITAKINTAELVKEWEERAERARELQVFTLLGAKTDLGRVRENNEDKFEFFQPDDPDVLARKGSFYAVADGMGGHSAGQIASELALKTAIKAYYSDSSPIVEESLRASLQQANALIFDTARAVVERAGMGTTMTALIIRGEEAFIAQVGDSRCYRLRDGKISQLTQDHSWVNEQVKRGGLSQEEAETSPFRNVITRSLGNAPNVEVDIYREELEVSDKFLLCSDGLSGEVKPGDMADAMKNNSPSQAAQDLVELALERGGRDNVTVLILSIIDIIKSDAKEKRRRLGSLLSRGK